MRPVLLMRDIGTTSAPRVRSIGLALAAGVLLAALGPFGNYLNGNLAERIGYWCAATLLGLVIYGCAFQTVAAYVPTRSRAWWPAILIATLVASLPEAIVTRGWAFRLWPELGRLELPFSLWFAQTTMIGIVAMAGAALMFRRAGSAALDEPGSLERVPPSMAAFARDVLALQMEDHYVRVHHVDGSELVLLTLNRAIEGVDVEGLRTHRSWWVATRAVAVVEGDARSMRVHLTNGVVVPVARSAVARLRAAGWISNT